LSCAIAVLGMEDIIIVDWQCCTNVTGKVSM
jgi:hypothetical protein